MKNFLLTREKKFKRKMKELILAYRLEKSLSKKEILELYLNEIYLGNGAYGVESAARTYFGKISKDLTISEACILASVVPRPNNYAPTKDYEKALERRDSVLTAMLNNGFINKSQYKLAKAEKPKLREKLPNPYERAPYFTEAVRRYIVDKYGEERLYNDGLKVWTTCDLELQKVASRALLKGARAWEKRQKRPRGLVDRDNPEWARKIIEQKPPEDGYKKGDIIQAVVISDNTPKKKKRSDPDPTERDCVIAMPGNDRIKAKLEGSRAFQPNDIIELRVTESDDDSITLVHNDLPPIQGAVVSIENKTGYVRALVGGLDFKRSHFNRAIQAMRQPGSAFKPFIFAAGFEWANYSPRTVINDEPIMVLVDELQEPWVPLNSSGKFVGPVTVHDALIHSKNVPSIKLLMDVGTDRTIQIARQMGVQSPLGPNLSLVLGSSEVTPMELTSAYSVIPNMGIKVAPVLIKKVVDRFGNVLEDNTLAPVEITEEALREASEEGWGPQPVQMADYQTQDGYWYHRNGQWRFEPSHTQEQYSEQAQELQAPQGHTQVTDDQENLAEEWRRYWGGPNQLRPMGPMVEYLTSGQFPQAPREIVRRPDPERVISPQTAYLMASLMKDVCVYGTGAKARKLKRKDISGKTGTTDDCTDSWFVGFNPTYTTGVWVGFDNKISLGKKEYGSKAALPVWIEFMGRALEEEPERDYPTPPYIEFWNPNSYQNRYYAYNTRPTGPPPGGKVDYSREIPTKEYSPVDQAMGNMGYTYQDPNQPNQYAQPYYTHQPTNYGPQPRIDPWTGQPIYNQGDPEMGQFAGMARVLSANGQDLGQAPYYIDEDGNVLANREEVVPGGGNYYSQGPGYPDQSYYTQQQPPSQDPAFREGGRPYPQRGPFQNVLPHAQRFMHNLQRMLPDLKDLKHFEW
jgi:penicillin-binding protein 1A